VQCWLLYTQAHGRSVGWLVGWLVGLYQHAMPVLFMLRRKRSQRIAAGVGGGGVCEKKHDNINRVPFQIQL
jgi:hypothetical protein